MLKALLVLLAALIAFGDGAKILFLTCTPAPSHQKPFRVVWKALAHRGHELHVLTPNPINDASLTNLTEYDLSDFYDLIKLQNVENQKYVLQRPGFFMAFIKDYFVSKMWSSLYNRTLHHRATKEIVRKHKHFDLVIVEWIWPTLAAFGAYYKAPIVGITSLGAPLVALDALGNPHSPLVSPDVNLPLKSGNLDFRERILSVFYSFYVRLHYKFVVLPREDENIKSGLSKGLPYIGDIEKSLSLLLMNRNPVFHRVSALLPNTIDLGGIKEDGDEGIMDEALRRFLDEAHEGAIYFSLGSSMKSIFLEQTSIDVLKRTFKGLPFKVVWKWEDEGMEDKPENVFISQWVPQVKVLEHPNVKLFITQGGLQSLEEAVSAHKPIIGVPFHADQTGNVDACVKHGAGIMLELEDLSEDLLKKAIFEIMDDSSYTENVAKLDEMMNDQLHDPLEKAIWWIEYVIRHKGANHLQNIARELPWWQHLMLDVLGFCFLVLFSGFLIVSCALKLLFGRRFLKKKKKE